MAAPFIGGTLILNARKVVVPYDTEQFALRTADVDIGDIVFVQESSKFYIISDPSELDNIAGYTEIGGGGGGGGTWGSIIGTLSNQTDLQAALDAKQATITFGAGVQIALGINVGSAGAPVLFGGAGGTPSSLTLTNATGLPIGSVTGFGVNVAAFLATPSSANLLAAVTDETGSGSLVFATSPTLVTPVLGSATAISITIGSTAGTTGTTNAPGVGGKLYFTPFTNGTTTTITLPGSPAAGNNFTLFALAANGTSTFTTSGNVKRFGDPDTNITLITPGPAGNHRIYFEYVNGAWYFSDDIYAVDYAADAGSTDTYVISLVPPITTYTTGARYRFKANTANTGPATLNVNGIGAITIVKAQGGITTALADNDIRAGQWVDLVYDGTNFQMQSTLGNAPSSGATLGANTFTALQTITQATVNSGIIASTGYSLTGSNATNMIDLAGTFNTSGAATAIKLNMTNTSGANCLLMDLQTASSSMFKVSMTGSITANGNVNLGSGSGVSWSGRSSIYSLADGNISLINNATNNFSILQLGSNTSAFPALKRSAALVAFRLGDDSGDTGITVSTLGQSGKTTTYNNVATAGWGHPAIYASGRATAQAAANASVATYTVGAADGSFEVSANVLVTTATTHSFTVTCAYTDEGNTARTLTFNFSSLAGVLATSIINTGGAVPYEGVPLRIRCKAATSITIATTGTFTTVAYNVEASIAQIS